MVRRITQPEIVLGMQHNGLQMSDRDFEFLETEDGYRSELIEGVVEVSPAPDLHAVVLAARIRRLIESYTNGKRERPFVEVLESPRIIVPDVVEGTSVPQPDVAAYLKLPKMPQRSYRGVNPVLAIEIVSPGGTDKDYVRNRRLYSKVAEILEYWVVDPTKDMAQPSMTVFCRSDGDSRFVRHDIKAGGRYECKRWPGLCVDLARIAVD